MTSSALAAILETSLNSAGIASIAVDRDGRIVHITKGFFVMTDLEDRGLETLDALVSALRGAGPAAAELAESFGDEFEERDITVSDARILRVHLDVREDGTRVWTFRNVTVERRTVDALGDAENWLRMFAAHTSGVVMELDAETRIIGLWSEGTSLIDSWQEGFEHRTIAQVVGPSQGPLIEERLRTVVATGKAAAFEYVMDVPSGQRVFAANALLLPAHGDGAPTLTVLIRDVTERARLQQQLLQAERLASLGLLAAGVAHEVNNPLAYMLLNLEHVLRGLGSLAEGASAQALRSTISDYEARLGIAVEGARRVQEIVQDLRRFSRSDELEPARVVDVRDVLRFTLAMIGAEIGKRARLVRDFGPVPKVLAGEGRLNQVFLNLLINAVQAIEEGGGATQEIRLVTATDLGGNAVVEIHDTGTGIPEAHLPRIFDPFFTTKAAGIGTGLGLAICHGITTSLGGALTVESHVGVGSVFRVVLPPTTAQGWSDAP